MLIRKVPWIDQLQQLLPQGVIWDYELESNIDSLIKAIQSQLEATEFSLVDLYNDLMPDSTTGSFLERWEETMGLPNSCTFGAVFTENQRRDNVIAQLNATGGQSRAYYLGIMANLGYPNNTIEEYKSLRIGDDCDDFVRGTAWDFTWKIIISEEGLDLDRFNCQSNCDDYLGNIAQDIYMKCLMQELKPAHTVLLFGYA